ncbi:hypothetical protein AYI69_g1764 [Smittium culicis]|uniref:Uncharacterized protein n=1 Tax=Smittium culicis TaxID=133412 RepID=A0A1R1YPB5_9FUNG|nr:hypothetical protein AYI69_g1764 [Smittium culicis]
MIKQVDGPEIKILGTVVLNVKFEKDMILPIEFQVLKNCTVPIILERDACQFLKSSMDYENEIWTFSHNKRKEKKQLFNRSELSERLEFVQSDSLDSDLSEYFSSDSSSSDT